MNKDHSAYLAHHGIKGQKWGVRRFQNEDGTLINPKGRTSTTSKKDSPEDIQRRREQARKIIGIAAGVAVAGLLAYGAFKADYHLTGIRDKLRSDAKNLSLMNTNDALTNAGSAQYHREERILATDKYLKTPKDAPERKTIMDEVKRHTERESLHRRQAMAADRRAHEYAKISKNLTRRQAAKHFLSTKGHISVEHLQEYGDVKYNKKDWDWSLIRKQNKDLKGYARDKLFRKRY